MIYLFVKRFLPILAISIIICMSFFAIYFSITPIISFIIGQKSHEIREYSFNDTDYANNVKLWAYHKILPTGNESATISSAEIAYLTGHGDCSERSLLITKMLNDEGIAAKPIYGVVGRIEHESVEYTTGGITRRIDEKEFPTFVKSGDGFRYYEHIQGL